MSSCYKCGAQFPTRYFSDTSLCSNCELNKVVKEESEKTRRFNEDLLNKNIEFQRRQFVAQQAGQALASISSDQAYQAGKDSIVNYSHDSLFVRLFLDEMGGLSWQLTNYLTNIRLVNLKFEPAFIRGMQDGLLMINYKKPNLVETKKLIFEKSREMVLGMQASKFSLHFLSINGCTISDENESNMIRWRISGTEYIDLAWSKPFKKMELNNVFCEGVNRAYWLELNTQGFIEDRIKNPNQLSANPMKETWAEKSITEFPRLSDLQEREISEVSSELKDVWNLISQNRDSPNQNRGAEEFSGLIGLVVLLIIVSTVAALMGGLN
jgi:hypothetical protein